jgi:transcription elongation factor/antiterminator RfaH
MLNWYVFQSKTRKEQFLCEQLHMRQVETFFPCIRVNPLKSTNQKLQPYFPGYVFGRVDLEAMGRSALNWLPGLIRIVNFGGDPVSVQDYMIHVIRQHVDTINRSAEASRAFQPGDVVMIQRGPFAGYEAIFNTHLPGRDRAEVLLKMLEGSQLRVELAIEHIVPQRAQYLSSY